MPSRRDSATKPATSSRVKALVTSSRGSTPTARSVTLANQFSSAIAGRSARTIMASGGARISAARSGPASARFFGTISPSTTCR